MDYTSRRINDIPYLGVREDKIKSANPTLNPDMLKLYYHYMTERYNIQKKRANGEQPPWTDDKVLQENSFTCVKRWQDKTSQWLINHICQDESIDLEDRFFQTIMFRLYNRIDTAEVIGLGKGFSWNTEKVKKAIEDDPNKTRDYYTRAFKTVGLKNALRNRYDGKIPDRLLAFTYVQELYDDFDYTRYHEILDWNAGNVKYRDDVTAEKIFKYFKNMRGFGGFMAMQCADDQFYIPECPVSESEFIVPGPGAIAGMNLLFVNKDGLSDAEILFWLRDHFDEVMQRVDPEFSSASMLDNLDECNRKITVNDCQNSGCEFSKYVYVINGCHLRPRKYVYGGN